MNGSDGVVHFPPNGTFSNLSQVAVAAKTSGCNWPPDATRIYDATFSNTPTLYYETILYPILLVLCTFGNILTITVMVSDRPKTTTNVYLICMAMGDLCIMWLGLYLYIPEVDRSLLDDPTYFQNTLNFRGFQAWWRDSAIQFSDWTLIVFSLERLYAIARPFEHRYRLTVKRAIVIELFVFLAAALSAMENAISWYYMLARDDGHTKMSKLLTPALREWDVVQAQAEVAITITKWAFLTVLNVALMSLIAKHNMIRKTVLNMSQNCSSDDPAKRATTIVLCCSIAIYFVTQFPMVVYRILVIADKPPFCTYNFKMSAQNAARPIVYTTSLINYSINFFIYCFVWSKFRRQLRHVLRHGCGKRRRMSNAPGTAMTTASNTPAGPNDPLRMGKLSLENQDVIQMNIGPLLKAVAEHARLKQITFDSSNL